MLAVEAWRCSLGFCKIFGCAGERCVLVGGWGCGFLAAAGCEGWEQWILAAAGSVRGGSSGFLWGVVGF